MSAEQWFLTFMAVLLFALFLRWDIARHPYAKCRRCGGSGRHYSLVQFRWGDCRRCGGSGKRRGLLPRMFGKGDS